MREIKFRAWDKEGRRMVTPYAIYDDGSCRYVESHYQGEQEPAFSQETLTPEGCILMQYTGLLDKSGKEIYEGDIVKFTTDKSISSIIFKDGSFRIETNNASINLEMCKWFEIIGNLYENNELLK